MNELYSLCLLYGNLFFPRKVSFLLPQMSEENLSRVLKETQEQHAREVKKMQSARRAFLS